MATVKAVKYHGIGRSVAIRKFDVPPSTLSMLRILGECYRVGAGVQTFLSSSEEKARAYGYTTGTPRQIGFGVTKKLVRVVIHDYLKHQPARPNHFQHGKLNWWWLF